MEGSLFEQATDPTQYDKEAAFWANEREAHSPSPDFFRSYLATDPAIYTGKDIVDIGSGTGWLLDYMHKAGARSLSGIEPARHNVEVAQERYPHVQTLHVSLEEYSVGKEFDIAIAVMVFTHILHVGEAFVKIAGLLRPGGQLWMVVPDFDYAKTPRFGYDIMVEDRTSEEYVVKIARPSGTIADVVRHPSVYKTAAQAAGFVCTEEVPMKPTSDLLAQEPRYAQFEGVPLAVLLRFTEGA